MFLLLIYAFLNIGNILYFKVAIDFIGLLLVALAGLYFVQRGARISINGFQISLVETMAACLLIFGFFVLLVQQVLYESYIGLDGLDVQQTLMSTWTVSVLWFFIGGAVSSASIKESPWMAILLAGGLTAMMGFGVDRELFSSFRIDDVKEGSISISHLTLERYVVIPLVVAYALSPKTRWLVALCGVYCLFLIGGRTALFTFIITLVLMNIRGNVVRNLISLALLGSVVFFGMRYMVGNGIINPDSAQVREILFLGGVGDDQSYNARVTIFNESLQDLPQQFLVGNFSITVERFGHFGTYIHNLLSAWQFYGFFMLTAIVAALTYCVLQMFKYSGRQRSPIIVFSSFVLIYVIISVIIGKYVGYTLMWFTLGLWMLRPIASNVRRSRSRSGSRRKARGRRVGSYAYRRVS